MDVFAVGIVLREIVTGGDDKADPAALPPALDRIVAKATSVRAEDRYQSAEEMARALEQFGAGERRALSTISFPSSATGCARSRSC